MGVGGSQDPNPAGRPVPCATPAASSRAASLSPWHCRTAVTAGVNGSPPPGPWAFVSMHSICWQQVRPMPAAGEHCVYEGPGRRALCQLALPSSTSARPLSNSHLKMHPRRGRATGLPPQSTGPTDPTRQTIHHPPSTIACGSRSSARPSNELGVVAANRQEKGQASHLQSHWPPTAQHSAAPASVIKK